METLDSLKKEIKELKKRAASAELIGRSDEDNSQSQIRFRTVFENSRLANKIIDKDLKILQANQALVELLGYSSKEELLGAKILDFAPEGSRDDWKFLQQKLWDGDTPSFSLETRLRKQNGDIVWCQVTSILFKDGEDTLGYTILENITERHQLRVQKDEFISVASHELKTPITTLNASIQIIKRLVGSNDKHDEGALLKIIETAERSSAKLVILLDDLLSTTKVESGNLTLNKSCFAIRELIDDCCNHVLLTGKRVISITGDTTAQVIADQHKIEQVLTNFLTNAVKYAPESKEIIISVSSSADKIKIAVTDQGNGIPSTDQPHIFERFYRGKAKGSFISGLGLGLYISSEIVKRHDGEIGVESQPGSGATFWFNIPV